MSNQSKRPGIGLYFVAILLLLGAYYLFYGAVRTPSVTYAQVRELFQSEQVQTFSIRDGDSLYLSLRDGSVVYNELGSTALFWRDLGELIQDQKERKVLADYDYAPVYTPPWWSSILLYVLMIGGLCLAVYDGPGPGGRGRRRPGPPLRQGPHPLRFRQQG